MLRLICVLVLFCLSLTTAHATPLKDYTYRFQVSYDVYAGGAHLLDVTQDFSLSATGYDSTLVAKPTGMFSKIVPWEGRYSTQGKTKNGQLTPSRHTKFSRWSTEYDETIVDYDTKGRLVKTTNAEWEVGKAKPPVKDIVSDPALSNGTVDLVTAVLQMLAHAQETGWQSDQACQSAPLVFDGKRRFTMAFSDLGIDTLAKSNYNAFYGKARHCQIEIKPIAGFPRKNRGYYKIQEDSRAHGGLPSLWLMPAWIGGPPIPVRMLVKSEYGAILVHATKVTRK